MWSFKCDVMTFESGHNVYVILLNVDMRSKSSTIFYSIFVLFCFRTFSLLCVANWIGQHSLMPATLQIQCCYPLNKMQWSTAVVVLDSYWSQNWGCRRGHDRIVVGFTTTCVSSFYHHLSCKFVSSSWRGVLDTCDKVVSDLRQVGCFSGYHKRKQKLW